MVIYSKNERETCKFAADLWDKVKNKIGKRATIIALSGPLGAGKTTFTKGLAQAIGIKEIVLSPTFTLHGEYGPLDHIDLWRIEDPQELVALGLDEMIAAKKVVVIEWAEKAREIIESYKSQTTIIWIKFGYGQKPNQRLINWTSF